MTVLPVPTAVVAKLPLALPVLRVTVSPAMTPFRVALLVSIVAPVVRS